MIRNERGIALVITLLVISLLAITVIEFAYSVEVDQRMARNALNGVQAALLVRSGINLGEAFLLHDTDIQVDSFSEEWCPQSGPEGHSCRIDESNSQMVVPDNMRLRVEIFDESGKVNINLTKPASLLQLNQYRTATSQGQAVSQPFAWWLNALKNLLQSRGIDPEPIADGLMNYWEQVLQSQPSQTGQPGVAAAAPQATPTTVSDASASQTPTQQLLSDFPSLDDAAIIPGFTPEAIRRLRPVLTAGTTNLARVNANTAPRAVLNAIIGDGDAVEAIISARQEQPLKPQDLTPLLVQKNKPQDPAAQTRPQSMLGSTSNYFQIRASAIVNPNPVTGRGGVSRSASMLVRRQQKAGVAPNAPAGTPRWTLTRLDWQKEGGAALFDKVDQGSDTDETSSTASTVR